MEKLFKALKKLVITAIVLFFSSSSLLASEWQIVTGLSQPLVLGGGNLEINYLTDDFIFEYSHGWDLDLSKNRELTMTKDELDQELDIYLPYSTGGGIGYRFSKEFNLRIEAKQHQYNITERNGNKFSYTTRDLGLGAYYTVDLGNSFILVPSLRYWPTIWSDLENDEKLLSDGSKHKIHEFGLFTNVSFGVKF